MTESEKKKVCSKCGKSKSLTEFNKSKNHKYGRSPWCKTCSRDYDRKWQKNNLEKHSANSRKYYAANLEKERERSRERRKAYPEKVNESRRKWRAENSKKAKDSDRKWRKANIENRAASRRNRRAKKRQAGGSHTENDIKRLFDRQGGLCNACGKKLIRYNKKQYHVDHVIPLAKGGSNRPDNLQLLCPFCNLSKNVKDPIEWARENGRLF